MADYLTQMQVSPKTQQEVLIRRKKLLKEQNKKEK